MNLYNDEEQPKALQFAEQLDADECADIADELRRLHDENKVYSATIMHLEHENDAQLRKLVSTVRQRDELLEALRMNAQSLAWLANGQCRGFHPGLPTVDESLDAARSAIAKTTGEKS